MSASTLQLSRLRNAPAGSIQLLKSILISLRDPTKPLLPFIPKTIKIIFFLLILINSPSWPFTWHIRVWKWPLKAYWDLYTKGRHKYLDDFLKRSIKAGGVYRRTKMRRIAWFDDCDYNLHLSNSAYAKNGDAARMQWAIEVIAPSFTPGVHMALGASHYVFIKEIPLGSEYLMETRVGGWGEKWIYLVTEYIMYPKKSKSKGSRDDSRRKIKPDPTPAGPSVPKLMVSSASSPGESTPEITPSPSPEPAGKEGVTMEEVRKSAGLRSRLPREDGGVVCCVSVVEYCFKQGRVTVPPRICLHLGLVSEDEQIRAKARDLIINTKDRAYKWSKSGWKEEADASEIGTDLCKPSERDNAFPEGWVDRAREGMDKVNEGLSVFGN